jgi:hypothetical protein
VAGLQRLLREGQFGGVACDAERIKDREALVSFSQISSLGV